jgi:hypothetical protein
VPVFYSKLDDAVEGMKRLLGRGKGPRPLAAERPELTPARRAS